MNFFVYIYFDRNGIPRYVGKGKNTRDTDHIQLCQWPSTEKSCRDFYKWLREQQDKGFNPEPWRMAENLTEPEAFDLEITCIAEYGRIDLGTGTLTNLTTGGENPPIATEQTRAKIVEALRTPK